MQHIDTIIPQATTKVAILLPASETQVTGLCVSGKHILSQPLQLPCEHHMCTQCVRNTMKRTNLLYCAECKTSHPPVSQSLSTPSSLLLDLLADLVAKCPTCGEGVQINIYRLKTLGSCVQHHWLRHSFTVLSLLMNARLYATSLSPCLYSLADAIPFSEDAIQAFLSYYRRVFPEASITVKLHMLEEHLVPFLKRWNGVGFGIMAEQGAESIHHEFNTLMRRYLNIPDRVQRLHCVLQEHFLRCCPSNRDGRPSYLAIQTGRRFLFCWKCRSDASTWRIH